MIKLMKGAIVTGVLTLGVTALAMANGNKPETVPPENTHATSAPTGAPNYAPEPPVIGPKAPLPEKAKAYGVHCRGESKKHESGEKGTAFSRCVTNMAQAAVHQNMAPGRVCKGESKQHTKGDKGQWSDFRTCVHHVVEMRREEREENNS
jgi:hypothetical protein